MVMSSIRRWLSESALPLLSLLVIALLWEAAVVAFDIPPYILPTPTTVLLSIQAEWGQLGPALAVTLFEVMAGFALSVVIGVLLAVVIVSWPVFEKTIYPILVSLQIVPKVAIAPLLVVWFGFGLLPKVLMAFLIAFFPMVISTVTGLRSIEISKLYLAQSMGASAGQTFFKIRLPHAFPSIFSGMKLSIAAAMIGAIVGEFIGADRGVGRILMIANGNLQTDLLFAGVILLSLTGVLLFMTVEMIERWVLGWHVSQRSKSGAGVLG
jgi:NitT/TauT family transport system permease protein